MAPTNRPNASAPSVSVARWPSTSATAIQSLAEPSVKANPSTRRPTSSVRGSRQARSTPPSCLRSSGATTVLGRNRRVVQTIISGENTAIAATCTLIGTPSAAVSVPIPAPSTVPKLKPACSRGINGLPSRRSTSAPSTFIDTSHTPMPSPTSMSPNTAGRTRPVKRATAVSPRPIPSTIDALSAARAVPNRCTSGPESGRPTIDPPDMHRSNSPSCAVVSPSDSRTAGVREANEANARPLVAKVTKTAVRARSRPGAAWVVVTEKCSLSNRFDAALTVRVTRG